MFKERVFCLSLLIAAGSISQAAEKPKQDFIRIAIVPFVNISGIEERDAWGSGIAELMVSKMSSVKGIVTYKPSDLMVHLRQLGKTSKGCTTKEAAFALGKRCSADWVVYGTLDGKNKEIDVSIKLLEIAKCGEQALCLERENEEGLLELDIILVKKLVDVLKVKDAKISIEKATNKKGAFEYYAKGCQVINDVSGEMSYSKPEQYQKAFQNFKKSTIEDPKYSEAYVASAFCASILGQIKYNSEYYSQAVKLSNDALRLSPNQPLALMSRGYAETLRNNFDKGIDDLKKAKNENPDNAGVNLFIGYGLHKKGEYDNAIIYFRNEEKLSPKDPELQNCLGHLLYDMGRGQEAAKKFNISIELAPDYALAYSNLGNCLADKGEIESALWHFKKALALNSRLKEAHHGLATLYLRTRKIDLAKKEFERVLELDPTDILAHCGMSSVFWANNNMDKAAEILFSLTSDIKTREEVVSRFGTGLELWNLSQALTVMGNELFFKRQLLESEKCLLEAIFIWPDNGLAMLYLGRLWMTVDRVKFGAPMINGGCRRVMTMPNVIFAGILLEAKRQGTGISGVFELKHGLTSEFQKYLPQGYTMSLEAEEETLLIGLTLLMGHITSGIEPYDNYCEKTRDVWKVRLEDFCYNLETVPSSLKSRFRKELEQAGHKRK